MSIWVKILIPILVVELVAIAFDVYKSEELIHKVEIMKCQD